MYVLSGVTVLLILTLTSDIGHGYRDLTLLEDAKGSDVVRAVIAKFDALFSSRNSTLWSNRGDNFDSEFMRTLAYVESLDGVEDGTFRRDYHGGIWKVNQSYFQSISENAGLSQISEIYDTIIDPDVFGIDWHKVEWRDLRKPLYSAIAARLYIIVKAIMSGNSERCSNAPEENEYAQYWIFCYRSTSVHQATSFFSDRAAELDTDCRIQADVMFLLDSSASIGIYDWEKIKDFVYNYTSELVTTNNNNRVGVITFSYSAVVNINLTHNREILFDTIEDLHFINGLTNIADGLCKLQTQNWRHNALRLVILMTDGIMSPQESGECGTISEAIVFAHSIAPPLLINVIGVTNHTDSAELNSIASAVELVDHIDNFEEQALSSVQQHQTYRICFTASAPVPAGYQIIQHDSFALGERIRYQYNITQVGATIRLCTNSGHVILYASTTVSNPNVAYNDFVLDPTLLPYSSCADVFVDPTILNSNHQDMHSSAISSVNLYVSIEGMDMNNSFYLFSYPSNTAEFVVSCEQKPCGESQDIICTNDPVGFSCTCAPGFSGDLISLNCSQDINECEADINPCNKNAHCVNTQGSYVCKCNSGYTGNGTQCSVQPAIIIAGVLGSVIVIVATTISILICFKRDKVWAAILYITKRIANLKRHNHDKNIDSDANIPLLSEIDEDDDEFSMSDSCEIHVDDFSYCINGADDMISLSQPENPENLESKCVNHSSRGSFVEHPASCSHYTTNSLYITEELQSTSAYTAMVNKMQGNELQDGVTVFRECENMHSKMSFDVSAESNLITTVTSPGVSCFVSDTDDVESTDVLSMGYQCAKSIAQVPFLDELTVLTCDHSAKEYTNIDHDITIRIPEGAVPKGQKVQFEVAIALYGPFTFPSDRQPISPILWLCTQDDTIFQKPITVVLPHIIDSPTVDEQALLMFGKATHDDDCKLVYDFKPCEQNNSSFISMNQRNYGILKTNHCCFYCIMAKKEISITTRAEYCLHRIEYMVSPTTSVLLFCATFFLPTCVEALQSQYPSIEGYTRNPFRFKFQEHQDGSEPYLTIQNSTPSEWKDHCLIGLVPSEGTIKASEIDFWKKGLDELKFMHTEKVYPPRLKMEIESKTPDSSRFPLHLRFKGHCSKENCLDMDLLLPLRADTPMSPLSCTSSDSAISFTYRTATPPLYHDDEKPKLKDLQKELQSKVSNKWEDIGIQLEVDDGILGTIKQNNNSSESCFREMIRAWLNNKVDPPPSWSDMIEALETVGRQQVASDLKLKCV